MKTAPQNVESKAVAPRQPQYAWEMTLEQFQETYFPELCGKPTANDSIEVAERKAA